MSASDIRQGMRRGASAWTFCCALAILAGCFGDNDLGVSPEAPVIVEFSLPQELDGGDSTEVKVKVSSAVAGDVSWELEATNGAFLPTNGVLSAPAATSATFVTRFTADNVGGTATTTVRASNLHGAGLPASASVLVHEVAYFGRVAPIATTFAESANTLIAFPITVDTGGAFRKIAIDAPEAGNVLVGLYDSTVAGEPGTVISKGSLNLSVGTNVALGNLQALAPGKYWIVTNYELPLLIRRSDVITERVDGRYMSNRLFAQGLPDTLPFMLSTMLYPRNYYLVLRK